MGALKFVKAVYRGVSEYGAQSAQANRDADRNLRGTYGGASTEADAMRVADETKRLKKERGVSLRNSVRKHLNLESSQ